MSPARLTGVESEKNLPLLVRIYVCLRFDDKDVMFGMCFTVVLK